ncbi:MAG: DOMON-like domain-containing protein [Nitrospirota bacterium]|nr:DOMON-like domain-containing protein [Nitrospirota bacterium]
MNEQRFALEPFHAKNAVSDINITGSISRSSNIIAVSFIMSGLLKEVVIPGLAEYPQRRNALWEETCLEFFLGQRGSDQYWEFNLSPAGHWNVYRFDAYREGMQEEAAFHSLPFRVSNGPDTLLLDLELDPGNIITGDTGLDAAVSAVVKLKDGRMIYWALTHPGPVPDFHHRDGFIIGL